MMSGGPLDYCVPSVRMRKVRAMAKTTAAKMYRDTGTRFMGSMIARLTKVMP
jgi:hypothetical protein